MEREEGQKLLEQSQLKLWQGGDSGDAEKIAKALELEKQARVLLGKALWLPGYCAAAPQFKSCHPLAR